MTTLIHETLADMRGGRQSWRVILTFCVASLAISIASALVF